MMEVDFVRSRFIKHFDGKTGNVYASPGRINLIGEHTDYNGGFVFPGAVDKGVMAEMRITFARIHNLVFTPVESRTPVAALLVGNTIVDLLDISLEVVEVLEGDFRRHLRTGLLVEVVGA